MRAQVVDSINRFLSDRGSLWVDTPQRVRAPGTDVHLVPEPSGGRYLITSPELHMKRLVAAGLGRVHQLCHCFRQGEVGGHHNPEFLMLEWYRPDATYEELADEVEALVRAVATEVMGTTVLPASGIDVAEPWERITVAEAFERHAGWTPGRAPEEERFFRDLVVKVEPRLGQERPTFLMDYPASMAALARLKPTDPAVSERFELYVGGLELVNAFGELVDPVEQRERFASDLRQRKAEGKPPLPVDEPFLDALEEMGPTSGAALGVDRLVMLLTGAQSIDLVMPFTETTV